MKSGKVKMVYHIDVKFSIIIDQWEIVNLSVSQIYHSECGKVMPTFLNIKLFHAG